MTATRSTGAFTFGTTALDDGDSTVVYTDATVNTGFTDLLDGHSQTVFTSIATLSQRLLFTYGSQFGFTAALNFKSTTALSYYTAEQRSDSIVRGIVSGRFYLLIGEDSTEYWQLGTNNDAPLYFTSVRDFGCLERDTVQQMDEAIVLVCHDGTIRSVINGQDTVLTREEPWLARQIADVESSTLQAFVEARANELTYVLRSSTWCYAFNVTTQRWHKRETHGESAYRWGFSQAVGTNIYRGAADGTEIALIDDDAYTDCGDTIVSKLSMALPGLRRGDPIGPLVLDIASGVGLISGQGSDPLVQIRFSHDAGNTWGNWHDLSLGAIGEYGYRPRLNRCGRMRSRPVFAELSISDPVNFSLVGATFAEAA